MRKLNLLSAGAVLALGLVISGPTMAAITVNSATVDGGADTTVAPSTSITVELEVTADDNTDWKSTKSTIGAFASVCHDTSNTNTNPGFTVTKSFPMTAPDAAGGPFNLKLQAFHGQNCADPASNEFTLTDAITVVGAAAEVNDIEKTLEAGPYDELGDNILFVPEFGLGGEPTPDSNDDGVIGVGLDFDQHYWFSIAVTDVADGTVIYDVIPAEYNLDSPDIHDITDLGGNGLTCDPAGAVDCTLDDGICHDRDGAVVACSNVVVTGDCTATPRQPAGSKSGETARFLEPELLTIIVGDGGGGDFSCTVDVLVVTDGNPGHWVEDGPPPVFTLYEPTSCLAFRDASNELLGDGAGDPIVDSIALNDGFKDFDPVTGDRISGPRGSLQLTPVGCDSDDDGVIDELDVCPIDGPPLEGQVEDNPGCWVDPV